MNTSVDIELPIRRHLLDAHAGLTLLQFDLMSVEEQASAVAGRLLIHNADPEGRQ